MEQQNQDRTYVSMMEESLKKEQTILRSILRLTEEQRELLLQDRMEADAFDNLVDRKGMLIEELNKVSDGFQRLYQRVGDVLTAEKEVYCGEIQRMQQLIAQIAEFSAAIQSIEQKNSERFQVYLEDERKMIRNYHVNNRTASAYYRNMRDVHRSENTYFFDKIK